MTTIIGVDGALAKTGLAVWRDGLINVRTIHTAAGGPPEPRWATIGEQIWPIIAEDPHSTLILLEAVFAGAKMLGTALDLAMLHGTLRLGMHYRKVPFAIIDAQAIKQYAVGVGKASPREMIAATSRLRLKFHVGDDHQADGLFEVAMALDHYGAPMCDTFPAGRKALERVVWPKFTLGQEAWR
jgi:Holliday junction resolvasome RuvABC endonuclease subunit